ncbi:hypothetical protein BC829DRAFT_400211 [Chytridium lagenaria]|nr:hypothetical protein BC829DRAFT_400211 [Chytridium lagenaria]
MARPLQRRSLGITPRHFPQITHALPRQFTSTTSSPHRLNSLPIRLTPITPHVTPPSRFSQGTTAAIHLPWPSRYIRHITFPTHPDPFLVSSSFGISLLAVRLSPTPSTNLRSITIPNADAIPHRFILMLLSASPNLKSLSLGGMEVD